MRVCVLEGCLDLAAGVISMDGPSSFRGFPRAAVHISSHRQRSLPIYGRGGRSCLNRDSPHETHELSGDCSDCNRPPLPASDERLVSSMKANLSLRLSNEMRLDRFVEDQ